MLSLGAPDYLVKIKLDSTKERNKKNAPKCIVELYNHGNKMLDLKNFLLIDNPIRLSSESI